MGTNQSQPVPSQSSKKKRPFYDSCLSNELEPDKKRADREDVMIPDPTKLLNERMNRILSPINPRQLCVACLNKFPFYDYRFLKKVGEGKFTVVYKGIIMNDESAPKVAIRETSVDLMDAAKYEDLKFELNILSQMKYPNFPDLIAIYEPPMFNAKFYSVTEYIRGGEMVSALASHETYTFLDLLFYFQQILSAIHYLHHRGVVHNNLVPENIVFDRKYNPKKRADNRIKIVGFDRLDTVVAAFPKRPIQKTWTDNYFYPPEVGNGTFMDPRFSMAFHRTEKVDEAVLKQAMDIWLFGELFFFLIGGYFLRKLPYNPSDPVLFVGPVWSALPNSARQFFQKALNFNPLLRSSTEDAMNDPWFNRRVEDVPEMSDIDLRCNIETIKRLVEERISSQVDPSAVQRVQQELPNKNL